MAPHRKNRFDDFFADTAYLSLKNHLYSHLVRKQAVRGHLPRHGDGLTLEVGSGISPVLPPTDRTVFTELSVSALQRLRAVQGGGRYVAADAGRLPFRAGTFQLAVCSEVLEHIEDDRGAVREIAGVLKEGGRLVVTFPHRMDFFAFDDLFVGHHRRYDRTDMVALLDGAGLQGLSVHKVLGPLEKFTMAAATPLLAMLPRAGKSLKAQVGKKPPAGLVKLFELGNRLYAGLAKLDARMAAPHLASVLLIVAEKRKRLPADPIR